MDNFLIMRSFDNISPVYDLLTFVIFGRQIQKANTLYAGLPAAGDRVLVIGGGTGMVLPHFAKGVDVIYVEPSGPMLSKARKRSTAAAVTYIQSRFEDYTDSVPFDWIQCPFYLDLYPDNELISILDRMQTLSHNKTVWWISDFRPVTSLSLFHKTLLAAIKIFFRVSIGLPFRPLAHIDDRVRSKGWQLKTVSYFYGKMIFSGLYRRM